MHQVITIIGDNLKPVNYYIEKLEIKANSHQYINDEALDIFFEGKINKNLDDSVDYFVQPVENRRKKMLISDMDSTIIEQECIDELADYAGIKPQIAEITEKAMNGLLDFKQALRERVALLAGLPESALEETYQRKITFHKGARELIQTMSANGAFCLLVSGGFTFFTNKIAEELGFHANEANILEIKDGKLTGRVIEPILDKEAKLDALKTHISKLGISAKDVIAVGDGANDLPMIMEAGVGVAYHAKKIVQENANFCINFTNLKSLLYIQGLN